jgi:hypothetical protein
MKFNWDGVEHKRVNAEREFASSKYILHNSAIKPGVTCLIPECLCLMKQERKEVRHHLPDTCLLVPFFLMADSNCRLHNKGCVLNMNSWVRLIYLDISMKQLHSPT